MGDTATPIPEEVPRPSPKNEEATKNARSLLFQFSKTFVTVMESTVFARSKDSDDEGDETDEYFDDFERFSSYPHLSNQAPISDEEFAFEKYFPPEHKEHFRKIFVSVAFQLFQSYEYQLVSLVQEPRRICEIAEDIVHRILDNFKESQRGRNPDYCRPDITAEFLIEKTLQHTEPEGITYNSEWSAVEILENPGILIRCSEEEKLAKGFQFPGLFYQSDWQKNFVGVKKKIGYKYGFRLKFEHETELKILRNFEKVPFQKVHPPYLQYEYSLKQDVVDKVKRELEKELHIEEKMRHFGLSHPDIDPTPKDKVKEFQMKLQIQKLEEDRNSDKVMKQLQPKVDKWEGLGVPKQGLLKANYKTRFEVQPSITDFGQQLI